METAPEIVLPPPVYALSVRQPWAWLILHGKNPENRTWPTKFRGRFFIHAAQKMTRWDYEVAASFATCNFGIEVPDFDELQRGGIVGEANLVGCQYWHPQCSKWHETDLFGFYLADVKPLPFIPCRGALSFFKPKLP